MNAETYRLLIQHTVRAAWAGYFGTRELANTAYGAVCSGTTKVQSELLGALAGAAERRLGGFSAQELANTAWAFATASQREAPLFAALASAVERCLGCFSAQ